MLGSANFVSVGVCASVLIGVLCVPTGAIDITGRLKMVGTGFDADRRDAVAKFGRDPAYGINLDTRLTLADTADTWSWEIAGELTALQGDVIENASLFGGQSAGEATRLISDDRRALDLTWNLSNGNRHATTARLDRAHLNWQKDRWRVRIGRQALSLGSGRVFNPMDLFNPFAPTATDRDFKSGDDALVISHLGDNGAEIEALAVFRRAPEVSVPATQRHSYALRYRKTRGIYEYELVAARHFDAEVLMASLSGALGGTVWRVNWVGTNDEEFTHSLLANFDFAFGFRDQAGYAFVEYYYNGFGTGGAAEDFSTLDTAALERLARGELFVIERHYLALGMSLNFSPLTTVTATTIFNIDDGAPLLQASITHAPSDNQTLEFGIIIPTGGTGNEFGGIVLSPGSMQSGPTLTGSSKQIYGRLIWYF